MAVGNLLQTHHVLGHLAALHRGHTAERQLAADIAGGIDVRHVALAMTVDRDEPAAVGLDAGVVEAEPFRVGYGANCEKGVAAAC